MNTHYKHDVEIANVREVTLLGTADLAFWKERLQSERLFPTSAGGSAEILIGASEMKFMGVRFRELILSVFVCDDEDGPARDGVFLAHAFNSFWPFALIERTWFRTPYCHGCIQVDPSLPASFQLGTNEDVLLHAEMGADLAARKPLRSGKEGWEGPIHLPNARPENPNEARLFLGKIGGPTEAYAFDEACDHLTLKPAKPILQMLLDSHFRGREWLIRPNATHGKSKTIRRNALGRAHSAAAG